VDEHEARDILTLLGGEGAANGERPNMLSDHEAADVLSLLGDDDESTLFRCELCPCAEACSLSMWEERPYHTLCKRCWGLVEGERRKGYGWILCLRGGLTVTSDDH
jgi:hypothetical protein